MPILFLAVLITVIVLFVKYWQTALAVTGTLIALGIVVKLVRRAVAARKNKHP